MNSLRRILTSGVLTFIMTAGALAAEPADTSDVSMALAPKIYVDCRNCDLAFLQTEIKFVNFVRDRQSADVHVLVSTQRTGSGGTEYTLDFIGLGHYAGQEDTLTFDVIESASDDMARKEMARTIKMGILRYAMKSPLAKHISVGYSPPEKPATVKDPWDRWVFKLSGNTYFNGEESYHYFNFWGDISANRVTEASKTQVDLYWNYNENRYKYETPSGTAHTLSLSRSKGADVSRIWSLDSHWSAGAEISAYSSSYSNLDYRIYISPAIEYNLFPYDQSTRRQLRFQYRLRSSYVDYHELTIFSKMHEWLFSQSVSVALQLTQPWGTISSQLSGSAFFHDFQKNSLDYWNSLSLRLVKGLSFDIRGGVSRVHNQLSLPKGDASEQDVLLRKRQLATAYQYWGSVGLSFSFGSIYNNVVNPRFGD